MRSHRSRWGLALIGFCGLVVVTVALAAISSSYWLPTIGRFLVVEDPTQPSDAVVALAGGGRSRVTGAAQLLEEGQASWLIVTNMPLNTPGIRVSYADLMRSEAIWQGVPEDRILQAPGTVRTTYEEAEAVRRLAEERGFRSLTVVTDSFHTRRAMMAFRDAFAGSSIDVFVQPARLGWYQPSVWWQDRDSLRETWTEYLKLALYLVGYR